MQKTDQHSLPALLKKIESEHALLDKLLASLSPDDWLRPGVVADWTVKDVLAHLTAWEVFFRNWYLAGLQHETPAIPAPGYSWHLIDQLNRQILISNRDRPLEVVCSEHQASYIETLKLVQSIPEEDLFSAGRYAWTGKINLYGYVIANTCNHYRWARLKIRAWKR